MIQSQPRAEQVEPAALEPDEQAEEQVPDQESERSEDLLDFEVSEGVRKKHSSTKLAENCCSRDLH